MTEINTKELEALKLKAAVEVEQAKTSRLRVIFGFLTQLKWVFIFGGVALVLAKIGALPKSFSEIVNALTPFIPGK